MASRLIISAGSSIGGREENQDNLMIDTAMQNLKLIYRDLYIEEKMSLENETRYFLVCDGMGGMQDGAVASTMAVQYFYSKLSLLRGNCSCLDIYKFILDINIKMADYFKNQRKVGGCTFSLLKMNLDGTIETFNIGDSPIWLIRNGRLIMLSEEQNLAGIQLKQGKITQEQYDKSPQKNILLGNLGDDTMKSVLNLYHSGKIPYQMGDKLLIASDGLAGALGKERILAMIEKDCNAKELIENAKKADPKSDNITMIKIKIDR